MADSFIITLSDQEINGYNFRQAEEKIVYLRYLLRREQKDDVISDYNHYLDLLEARIQILQTQLEEEEYKDKP